ncbi:MAG: PilZ domain-containing protein [Spirochaetota bacterium]
MNDNRKFPRYECKIPVKFAFFIGNPDEVNVESSESVKGKGVILDMSKGGLFLVSNSRVNIDMPIYLNYSLKGQKNTISGTIVRTGLMKNNPSEIVRKYEGRKAKGDAYLAVKFDSPIEYVPE